MFHQSPYKQSFFLVAYTGNTHLILKKILNNTAVRVGASGVPISDSEKWYFTNNNSCPVVDSDKLRCEVACFGGNLTRLILGFPHPNYVPCERKEKLNTPTENSLTAADENRFYRVCNAVSGIYFWNDVVELKDDGTIKIFDSVYPLEEAPIIGLTSLLTAGTYVDEQDWDESNIGLIPFGAVFLAVRIDPGSTFYSSAFFIEDEESIFLKLQDLLRNYVKDTHDPSGDNDFSSDAEGTGSFNCNNVKTNKTEALHVGPLASFINYKNKAPINRLFNNKDELFSTLAKIISMPISLIRAQAMQDFSPEHKGFVENVLMPANITRKDNYYKAAIRLPGFKEYYAEHQIAYAADHYARLVDLQFNGGFDETGYNELQTELDKLRKIFFNNNKAILYKEIIMPMLENLIQEVGIDKNQLDELSLENIASVYRFMEPSLKDFRNIPRIKQELKYRLAMLVSPKNSSVFFAEKNSTDQVCNNNNYCFKTMGT